jgi:hypothetical protein
VHETRRVDTKENHNDKHDATELQRETGLYDMKNLSKMKHLEAHAPEAMKAFVAFDKAALAECEGSSQEYLGGPVHEERSARRDSIRREAFAIMGSLAIHIGELSCLRGKGPTTDTKRHPLLGVGKHAFTPTSVEGVMSKIYRSMAILVLALIGQVGCDYETRAVGNADPVRVAEMRQTFRDLWLGHIYWVQHAVLNSETNSLRNRDAVEKEVYANTKQIANMITPFYGDAASRKLFSLLDINIDAVKEYSEATIEGNVYRQDAALARLANNADDFAEFLSGINPYLTKDEIRGLIAGHGAHHVLQINQYKKKDYAYLNETWTMMRQHVYVIADTLTTALAKQFPDKFS